MKLGMWIFMLVCNLLLPVAMVGFGWRFKKNPPKRINTLYGYRTARSLKNQNTWNFAQEYLGRLWWRMGWITACSVIAVECVILLAPTIDALIWWSFGVTLLELVVLTIATIVPVELALRKNFDENGLRRYKEAKP